MTRRTALATLASALLAGAVGFVLEACDGSFRFDEPAAPDAASPEAGGEDSSTVADASRAPCTDDTSCGDMRCHASTGSCVECLASADCMGAATHCETTAQLCVECLASADCKEHQRCDVTTHRCLDTCFDDDDPCPRAGFVCDRTLKLCLECRSSANCAGSVNGTTCDVAIGRCVECTGNAQCSGATPACDRRTGRCVGCVTSAACSGGGTCDKTSLVCR